MTENPKAETEKLETATPEAEISSDDYLKVKKHLEELAGKYQEQIDVVATESSVLAIIRGQINDCLELIALYQQQESELEEG